MGGERRCPATIVPRSDVLMRRNLLYDEAGSNHATTPTSRASLLLSLERCCTHTAVVSSFVLSDPDVTRRLHTSQQEHSSCSSNTVQLSRCRYVGTRAAGHL
ncbi:unnamed protein product [Laminaria digitata]